MILIWALPLKSALVDWWEIELSENSAGILDTDDLQDIPEDDDMIVFE